MMKANKLRFLPLVLVLLIAGAASLGLMAEVVMNAVRLAVSVVSWGGWVGGPFVLAICLVFLMRGRPGRVAADVVLGLMTLINLGAGLVSLLPFVDGARVFYFLPLVEFVGLTGLLALAMLVPELAKIGGSGTFRKT